MAHTDSSVRAGFSARLFSALGEVWDDYQHHRVLAETERKLEGLTDRQLRDIGIDRAEILETVYGRVYGL